MLSDREMDELLLEVQAFLAEMVQEYQMMKLGDRADYMLPKEVDNAGTETTAQNDLYGPQRRHME